MIVLNTFVLNLWVRLGGITPVFPALKKTRARFKFKASLGYVGDSVSKKKKKTKKQIFGIGVRVVG
jgi:hypothetical protein